ncbi:glycosyltransferase [Pectobacterium brasiliense]|uniref:Glycosyltransferase n=1 Tax=Pectobacterium brasiliense TaxID=180957 RepID=A0AAE3BDE9_9GAMM|nr:glycosyltransferase [Pectobacterium brasiliense]
MVAPDFPYPPNHGGRMDIWNRLKFLSLSGLYIDLIVTAEKNDNLQFEAEVLKYVKNIFYVPRVVDCFFALKGIPYQVASRKKLSKITFNSSYDWVMLESEAVSYVLSSVKANKIALRVHNNESVYFKSLYSSERNFLKKIYYFIESKIYSTHTKKIKKISNVILNISQDENCFDINDKSLMTESFFIPPHVDVSTFLKPMKRNGANVLFIGNLFTANNLCGLRWYIEEVHPLLVRNISGYKLIVAGNTRGLELPDFLKKHDESIILYESPKDLSDIYAQGTVFINPMLSGAGVKLKTIDAIAAGLPVVSTAVGAEGLGLIDEKHYFMANDSNFFYTAIKSVVNNPEHAFDVAISARSYLVDILGGDELLKIFMRSDL